MAGKKSKTNKPVPSYEAGEKRRVRILQVVFALFSIILILSMVLSLVSQ